MSKELYERVQDKPTKEYLRIARAITQEYIVSFGGDFSHIDDLDKMIALAIEKESAKLQDKLDIAINGIRSAKIIIDHMELHFSIRLKETYYKLESTLAEIQKIGSEK